MDTIIGHRSKRERDKSHTALSAEEPAATERDTRRYAKHSALKDRLRERYGLQSKDSSTESVQNRQLTFTDIHHMEPLERIRLIRAGVNPEAFVNVVKSMHRSKESFGNMLGLSATTVDRKLQKGQRLTADQSERLVATAKLIGQVQAIVDESGDPEGFDAAQWFAAWLDQPLHGLGGHKPAELMSTAEGRELISKLLATAQSGAYV